MSNTIGPSLPPHMQVKKDEENSESTDKSIGPALPPWLKENAEKGGSNPKELGGPTQNKNIGPSLPPWLKSNAAESEETAQDVESFGPALPPGLRRGPIGPAMPSRIQLENNSENDDEDIIGPLPSSGDNSGIATVAEEFEKRAKKMKDRLTGNEEPEKLEREEWMTELPPILQGFGGGARKFRTKEKDAIGDRSVWTDTPADRAKRSSQRKEKQVIPDDERINMDAWAKRDAEIAKKLANYDDEERDESLLSMHETTRKRKLEEAVESGDANVRRPFDRDIDLQANVFDAAAKKRMIKKTQGLSSRFSAGASTAKFL